MPRWPLLLLLVRSPPKRPSLQPLSNPSHSYAPKQRTSPRQAPPEPLPSFCKLCDTLLLVGSTTLILCHAVLRPCVSSFPPVPAVALPAAAAVPRHPGAAHHGAGQVPRLPGHVLLRPVPADTQGVGQRGQLALPVALRQEVRAAPEPWGSNAALHTRAGNWSLSVLRRHGLDGAGTPSKWLHTGKAAT